MLAGRLHAHANTASSFEFAMRFNAWAGSLHVALTAERIAAHWRVSRATSYRWLRAYNDALGRLTADAA